VGYHTCALLSDGTVDCWGENTYGELGNGTLTNSSTPVEVSGLTASAVAIGAGEVHTCALLADSTVECWGGNMDGELGNGTYANSSTPVPVIELTTTPITIAVGNEYTCALLADSTVECWGLNQYGQLGNGTAIHNSNVPVAVVNPSGSGVLSGVIAIAAGAMHTCAILAGGAVDCWGWDYAGQLGNGQMTTDSLTPVPVEGLLGSGVLSGAIAIAAGGDHTCALLSDGTVACWGHNLDGDLGNGTTNDSSTPVAVESLLGSGVLSNATAIAAGGDHTCVLLAGGSVDCLGNNDHGQLGNGTTTDSSLPVAVSGITSATAIAAGDDHTCALLADATVACWGYNFLGDLGNGMTTDSSTPVAVIGLPAPPPGYYLI
jgi:alpha-tubulin suppressor-like RCC1 family protein